MVKTVISVLLSRFQATDTNVLGCLKIHVVVWYVYFLILELAFESTLLLAYAFTIREIYWPNILSVSIIFILFLTLFIGFYAIYTEKSRFFRWFSLRTKLVYYSLFIWALINYFTNPTMISFIFSVAWTFGATIFVFEDYETVRTLDFVRYRYRGLNDKDEV